MEYSKLTNDVVIVLGDLWRDSANHTHVTILPQTPLLPRLPQNVKQCSLCYTVGPCWLSILNTAGCACFICSLYTLLWQQSTVADLAKAAASRRQASGGSAGKISACNAGDPDSIPGSGRSPGEGNGYPLQYSCLENLMDGGAWWAIVHGVAKSQTWLSNFHLT